jgi:hypothetical protein
MLARFRHGGEMFAGAAIPNLVAADVRKALNSAYDKVFGAP